MMKKLFLGFLFIYLNFDLSFNQFTLNVFPDFVGYIFLLQGVKELDAESSLFRGIRPFATGMVVYTAILWVGKLMGLTAGGNWVATLLELISTAVSLYISWVLIQGVLDMEQHHGADLNGKTLYGRWKAMVAVLLLNYLLALLANVANLVVVMTLITVTVLASLFLIFLFLFAWNRSAKAYEKLLQGTDGAHEAET